MPRVRGCGARPIARRAVRYGRTTVGSQSVDTVTQVKNVGNSASNGSSAAVPGPGHAVDSSPPGARSSPRRRVRATAWSEWAGRRRPARSLLPVFGPIWQEAGLEAVIRDLLETRRCRFGLGRAVFPTVLRRIMTSGPRGVHTTGCRRRGVPGEEEGGSGHRPDDVRLRRVVAIGPTSRSCAPPTAPRTCSGGPSVLGGRPRWRCGRGGRRGVVGTALGRRECGPAESARACDGARPACVALDRKVALACGGLDGGSGGRGRSGRARVRSGRSEKHTPRGRPERAGWDRTGTRLGCGGTGTSDAHEPSCMPGAIASGVVSS